MTLQPEPLAYLSARSQPISRFVDGNTIANNQDDDQADAHPQDAKDQVPASDFVRGAMKTSKNARNDLGGGNTLSVRVAGTDLAKPAGRK
jgi:hypothetical protein